MNNLLEKSIRDADGRYLDDAELTTLDSYVDSYQVRLKTYAMLCQQSEELILKTLQHLAKSDPITVRKHQDKCLRDMSYVVRSIALAILRDDQQGFREELVLWMQNIMSALHHEQQSSRAYRLFKEIIKQELPADSATLVNEYLDEFIAALTAGMA